jgi:molybdopterin-guanine dinucleotide biosynthesis protein A
MIKIDSNFHPRMFCFSGFSGSGKTTLLSKIIPELREFRIGYIKHDAHGFQMDKPGKDTFIMKEAGAEIVMINDENQEAILSTRSCFNQEKNIFLDSDIILIEGHKYSMLTKIILVDDELEVVKEIDEGRIPLPMAFVGEAKASKACSKFNLPFFDRDDIVAIANFIREKILLSVSRDAVPVYGLILSGGMSSRMKQDKGELKYHGVSQVEYSYNLLKEYCSDVFVSCRSEQSQLEHLKNLPQIHDRFLECGPLGGILSAMSRHRHAAWLVLACDLPMINAKFIKTLLEARDPLQMGTAFYHLDEKRFEPLAALYEPKSYHRMFYFLAEGKTCPQKVLYNSQVKIINFKKGDAVEKSLLNANTPEDFLEISKELHVGVN